MVKVVLKFHFREIFTDTFKDNNSYFNINTIVLTVFCIVVIKGFLVLKMKGKVAEFCCTLRNLLEITLVFSFITLRDDYLCPVRL